MDVETLLSKALGIESPWVITGINFDSSKKRLEINVDFVRGATFKHEDKNTREVKEYKAYDTKVKTMTFLLTGKFNFQSINPFLPTRFA